MTDELESLWGNCRNPKTSFKPKKRFLPEDALTKYLRLGNLQKITEIYFSEFWKTETPPARHQQIQHVVRAGSLLQDGAILLPSQDTFSFSYVSLGN